MNLKELIALPKFIGATIEAGRKHNSIKKETGFAVLTDFENKEWQLTDIIEGTVHSLSFELEYEQKKLNRFYDALQLHFHPTESTLGGGYTNHIIPSGANGKEWGEVKGDLQNLKSRKKYNKPLPIEVIAGYNPNENGHEIIRLLVIQENENPYTHLCPAYEMFMGKVDEILKKMDVALKEELNTERAQKIIVDCLLDIEMKTFEKNYSPFYKIAYLKTIDGNSPLHQYGTKIDNFILA